MVIVGAYFGRKIPWFGKVRDVSVFVRVRVVGVDRQGCSCSAVAIHGVGMGGKEADVARWIMAKVHRLYQGLCDLARLERV